MPENGQVVQVCDICQKAMGNGDIAIEVSRVKKSTNEETKMMVHVACYVGFKNQQIMIAHQMICALVHRAGGQVIFTDAEIQEAMSATRGQFQIKNDKPGCVSLVTSLIIKPMMEVVRG